MSHVPGSEIPNTSAAGMIRWWYKPSEKLPEHKEQVLIRHKDQVNLAYFDATHGLFYLRSSKGVFSKEDDIEWMCTLRPEGL